MDKLPYEDAAMRGAPLPEGLDLTDAAVYVALRGLYAFHQLGMMDRKEAAAEKQRLKKLRGLRPPSLYKPMPQRAGTVRTGVFWEKASGH